MKTSEQVDKIFPAIIEMQAKTNHANFNKVNPHFRSRYATLPEVIDANKEHLASCGLAILQLPGYREDIGHVLTTRIIHTSGQWVEDTMKLNVVKDDPQGLGSAITYARRYTQPGVTNTASEEDDDGNSASGVGNQQQPKAVKAFTDAEIKAINDDLGKCVAREELDTHWKRLGISNQHPQYAAIRSLFAAASSRISQPQDKAAA